MLVGSGIPVAEVFGLWSADNGSGRWPENEAGVDCGGGFSVTVRRGRKVGGEECGWLAGLGDGCNLIELEGAS